MYILDLFFFFYTPLFKQLFLQINAYLSASPENINLSLKCKVY